jgi:hypothetical protein
MFVPHRAVVERRVHVDPVIEPKGAQGVVIAQIFAVKPGSVDAFAERAETAFAKYRDAGAREAGVRVTLDARNNFPQLPIRTDGPFLVWLKIVRDDQTLESIHAHHRRSCKRLCRHRLAA